MVERNQQNSGNPEFPLTIYYYTGIIPRWRSRQSGELDHWAK